LDQFHLPRPLLLGRHGLQRGGGVAVSPAGIMKDNVNFCMTGLLNTLQVRQQEHTDAMWITLEVPCAQGVP